MSSGDMVALVAEPGRDPIPLKLDEAGVGDGDGSRDSALEGASIAGLGAKTGSGEASLVRIIDTAGSLSKPSSRLGRPASLSATAAPILARISAGVKVDGPSACVGLTIDRSSVLLLLGSGGASESS